MVCPMVYAAQCSIRISTFGLMAGVGLAYICTTMATLRNLNIKTSTCKRIAKELHSYEKEVEKESAKTADMKAKGADPYDLKQQVRRYNLKSQENVLAESRMMVPDCRKRLETALSDLKATLVEVESSGQKDGSEIGDARSTITEFERIF
ncbi:hypothetical protein SASPL_119039 [Salvia splendens]|uniref:Tubulin-specific chaperone A n=1 Tax=Salvia splendens TaxID=180675 RepID=A0A8X8Y1J9_SALSN|nr:hypothetical protein SASPL_119039 [Salvia splendens]